MIRPFTVICAVLAGASVLYTYRTKHEVQLLDRQIEKMLNDTASLRDQSRTLKTEFSLQENPERLRGFADRHLTLKPMLPTQFATMAELDTRLPAPRIAPPNTPPTAMPGTSGEDIVAEPVLAAGSPVGLPVGLPVGPDETGVATEALPIPPLPVPAPPLAVAAVSPASVPKPAPPAQTAAVRPAAILAEPLRPTAAIAATPIVRTAAAPMPMRPQATVYVPPAYAPPPYATPARAPTAYAPTYPQAPQPAQGGSLLGMAHAGGAHTGVAAPVPIPRPMPISATTWSGGN